MGFGAEMEMKMYFEDVMGDDEKEDEDGPGEWLSGQNWTCGYMHTVIGTLLILTFFLLFLTPVKVLLPLNLC